MSKPKIKSSKAIKKTTLSIALSILQKSDISFMLSHGKALTPTTLSHGSALTPTSIANLLTLNLSNGNEAEIRPKRGYEIVQVVYGSMRVGHKEEYYVHDFKSTPESIKLEIVTKNPLCALRFQVYYKPQ